MSLYIEISDLIVSTSDIVWEEREKSREKRRGVSSGPTSCLPLAASFALGFLSFSPLLPHKSFIPEYLGRFGAAVAFKATTVGFDK